MTQVLHLTVKIMFSLLLLCCITNFSCSQERTTPTAFDVTRRHLELIPPGTVIPNGPPSGWTNLIIKSHPRPAAGDANQLSASTAQLSSFLFTAIVANVQPDRVGPQAQFRLARLAVGMGTNLRGADTIITPETQKRLGANMGIVSEKVLETAEERLQEVQLVAFSQTMAIIDAPGLMLRGGRHRPVVIRYALLVEPTTGRLETLLWLIDRDDRGAFFPAPASDLQWLAPNKVEDCILHVDAREFNFLGMPTENAFAMNNIPQGQKQMVFPPALKAFAARPSLTPAMAQDLESKLKETLNQAVAAR